MKKPRQTPPPRVVLCVGLKSSGSTWLYNVVIRILKEADPGKGAVRAFFADAFRMVPPGAERARVLVIKSHEPSDAILFLTRFSRGRALVTVREPRDSVASLMQRFKHSFESALKDVREGGKHVVALARDRQTMILRYEDGFFEEEKTVGDVAAFLGVRLPAAAARRIFRALTREAVKKKIQSLKSKGTFGSNPDEFDPATHWHPGHVGDGRVGKFRSVLTSAQQGRIAAATREYAKVFGYPRPRKR